MTESVDADGDVDRWAREAAVALRRSMSTAPMPSGPRNSLGWRRPAFAVATVIVVVLGLTVIVRRHEEVPSTSSNQHLHWIVTDLPAGWNAESAQDIEPRPSASAGASVRTKIYATDAAPAGPIISVEWTVGNQPTVLQPGTNKDETGAVDSIVNGRRVVTANTASGGRVVYVAVADRSVRIRGRHVEAATLTRIAKDVIVDAAGDVTLDAGAIPVGLSQRAGWRVEEVDPEVEQVAFSRYTPGPDAVNMPDPRPSIDLSIRHAGSSVFAWLGLFAETPQPVTIAGLDGYYIAHIGGPQSATAVIAWTRDANEFLLTGEGVDQPTLLAAATSVREANTQQWRQLVDAAKTVNTAPNPCSLLSVDAIATATGLSVQTGKLSQAIGETKFNVCTYAIDGPLATIFVYLGHGEPPVSQTPNLGATETRGDVFVAIGAQNPDDQFTPIARQLADIAISTAAG